MWLLAIVGLGVWIVALIVFGAMWKEGTVVGRGTHKDFALLYLVGAFTILGPLISGLYVGRIFNGQNGQLIHASAIADKGLYLLQPATNVVCLMPAKLNGLTALLESNGSPAYYEAIRSETNAGPVVALRNGEGEMVLVAFPVSPERLARQSEKATPSVEK